MERGGFNMWSEMVVVCAAWWSKYVDTEFSVNGLCVNVNAILNHALRLRLMVHCSCSCRQFEVIIVVL